ncbi:MAG: GGDEF domain-containing protein [Desulfobacterales bacterium]|nr:GGDEF domain-containing protein [Desulfobacterales bacterium]
MAFQKYRINRRVLEDLESRATPGMYFYLVITAVVLYFNGFYQRHTTFSVIFASAITVVAVFRITQFYLFRTLYQLSRRFNYYAFFASVYATALIWGTGFAYFMAHPEETASQMAMLTSHAGLTAGGAVAFFPAWPVSVLYTLLMLVPGIAVILVTGSNLLLAFLFLLYGIYLPIIAYRGNREYWDALENEHLLKQKTKEIRKLSRTDGLTGLYNRRYFEEIFARQWKTAIRGKASLSLIIGDIDHFKQINDIYGHQAGDAFLCKTARLLQTILKRETDLIARYGGEEFVVLAFNMGPKETLQLAETIREKIETMRISYQNSQLQITISLGAAYCRPGKNDQKEEFLKKADDALYRAKNEGRNRVVFHPLHREEYGHPRPKARPGDRL